VEQGLVGLERPVETARREAEDRLELVVPTDRAGGQLPAPGSEPPGGEARSLPPAPGAGPVGAGYRSALRIGATTYAQHLEGCGVVSIHTLAPNGVGTRVHIPASLSNDVMIGAAGTKIAVVSATECGWPSWFGFYDPATKTTQKIIPDVAGELGVDNALAFPGR